MPDYTPDPKSSGETFHASEWTEATNELEEQEQQIAGLQSEVDQAFQEWIGALYTGADYTSANTAVPLDPSGRSPIGVLVTCVAPGPGGGSGARGAAGNVRCGGGGGGSGPQVRDFFIPVSPGDKYRVFIGKAGQGGAAVTTDNTPGNPGTISGSGAASSFTLLNSANVNKVQVKAWGNSSALMGQGGTIGASAGTGLGGTSYGGGTITGLSGGAASTTGGVGGTGSSAVQGAAASAGAGGGITAANAASNGGPGGAQFNWSPTGLAGAGGIVGGAVPTRGEAAYLPGGYPSGGPGGGAASTTGAAQDGADGRGYGAPGAGGGAAANGNNSGRGGHGDVGYVGARWVYA